MAAGAFAFLPTMAQATDDPRQSGRQADFAAAAAEFKVPLSVLLGVSHEETDWQTHSGYNNNGGWGLMNLTDVTPAMVAGGDAGAAGRSDLTSLAAHPELHTLQAAAKLTGMSADRIRHSEKDGIRAGAALLASHQKQLTGGTSTDPAQWAGAVARYSQLTDKKAATAFVNDVFATIRSGAQEKSADGQVVAMKADRSVQPATSQLSKLKLTNASAAQAECPASMNCQFIPAAPSNGQVSDRPANGIKITQIVLHDTEGSYDAAIQTFQQPGGSASHYVMRASDGAVTQMVPTKDLAFADGNYWSNLHSINIEHEGFAAHGAQWYTDAAYRRTAELVTYLAKRYDVPLDRQHIIGHDNVPGPSDATLSGMHWDQGPQFDWARLMRMIGAPTDKGAHGVGPVGTAVTIAPGFTHNKQTFTVCPTDDPSGATTACAQRTEASNFLYVRAAPGADAPLLTDQNVHPGAEAGTDRINDWSDRVQDGQQFVVAERSGDYTAIWFDGKKGWIFNPHGKNTIPAKGVRIIQATGSTTAPVYGTAYPDANEYPTGLGASTQKPLTAPGYSLPTGQQYVADQPPVNSDDYFTSGAVVKGAKLYYTIQFNHRYIMVNSADVTATKVRGH